MSPVALTLNLVLGALLVGAMILGLRLDRKLRALRESHSSFAKAVSELDQASRRTQESLAEIRETAEDARTALAARIDAARISTEQLVKLIAEAEIKAMELAKAPLAMRPIPLRQPAPEAEAPVPAVAPVSSLRSRAVVDDELFEAAAPAFAGGRR